MPPKFYLVPLVQIREDVFPYLVGLKISSHARDPPVIRYYNIRKYFRSSLL